MTRFLFSRRVPSKLLWLALALLALLVAPRLALALPVPPLTAHVNDSADLLPPADEAALEQKLASYESKTSQQFALLTIPSLQGDALEDFSIRVVEAWKLGKKAKDDGLLLLIVRDDHKLRIEVGYGLEGDVTDAFSSRVIRNVLVPALRAGKAGQGIDQAFDVLMKKASGQEVPSDQVAAPRAPKRGAPSAVGFVGLLFLLLPFLIPLVFLRGRGRRSGWLMGGLGALGGYRSGGGGGYSGGGFGGGGGGGYSGGGGGFGGGGASGSW